MDLDIILDVNVARLAHAGWELELERLVMGGPTSTALHIHANCDLGRWIYARGLHKYGKFSEIWELKKAHKSFHAIAEDIMRLKIEGHDNLVLEMLEEMRRLSRDVIYLLTSLELSVTHQKQQDPVLVQAWNLLAEFFGGDAESQLFPMYLDQEKLPWYAFNKKRLSHLNSMLDINAARLNHVIWVRNLEIAFSRLNRKKSLPDADKCSLGLWIHSLGQQEFLGEQEFADLVKTHKKFHDLSQMTLTALHRQDFQAADHAYEKVQMESRKLVSQLTHLELQMQNSKTSAQRMKSILL